MDALSELLRVVRLRGAVFFRVDARAPWAAESPPGVELAPRLSMGVEHVMEYHVITAGSCWASVVDGPATRLETGDVVVFPQGHGHVLASAPGMRGPATLDDKTQALTFPVPITVTLEGGGPTTNVVCGFLACDARPFNPLLASLPDMIVLRSDPTTSVLVDLALAESAAPRSGSATTLARLSELLFVEVVRRHVASAGEAATGYLAGLADPQIGKVLQRIHDQPAHDWSLDTLARAGGMSRSVLAERFLARVGIPPMQYLTQWRMQVAASLLTESPAAVAEVAERVGYGSEEAFSRAFKRATGSTPAQHRQRRAGPA